MKIGIRYRLFFGLLGATGLVAVGMFVIMQWSIDRGFLQYVKTLEQERLERLANVVEEAYAHSGGWDFIRENPGGWVRLLAADSPEDQRNPERMDRLERHFRESLRERPLPPKRPFRRFELRVVLLDGNRRTIFGPEHPAEDIPFRPITFRGGVVGYLGLLPPPRELPDDRQLRFVTEQKLALGLVAGLMLAVSALFSFPLAKRLVSPIRALAAATHRLAAGEYATRVNVSTRDELGQLAKDFNTLALTLEKNEESRRQWIADISHELRTPLAVLRGEIEALQDGVREATPEALASLHGETRRLGRLVEDLYQLSLSDVGALTYRKESIDLTEVLIGSVDAFRQEMEKKALALTFTRPPVGSIRLFADPHRLRQLFDNLIDNAIKYSDAGGRVEVRAESLGDQAIIDISDTAPGVPDAEMGRLFDRLYRVEASRSRQTGGAGLGLSICKNIVDAHGGTVSARHSPSGGVWIHIDLPLEDKRV